MSVRPHGAGWQVRFQHRGRPISRTVRGTKAQAQAYERRLRTELERRRLGLPGQYTIQDAIVHWLEGEALALPSYKDMKAKARHWGKWASRPLEEAPDAAREATKEWLRAGLKAATINRRIAALRRPCNLAFEEWKWTDEPLGKRIKEVPGETPRYVQATADQAKMLLAKCDGITNGQEMRKAIVVACLTGLRQGELLRFDPERHYEPGRIVLDGRTKTRRPRVIPLTREANLAVQALPVGLTYNQLRRAWDTLRELTGMHWLQWRDLRRTFGSWIVQRTKSLKAAQELLGHTTIQITAKHYAHLLDEHLVAAVGALPDLGTGHELASQKPVVLVDKDKERS